MTARRIVILAAATALTASVLAGCGGDDTPEASADTFCEQLAPLADLGQILQSGEADLEALAGEVSRLAAVAPQAVQPSVQSIAEALGTMAEAAAASGEEGAAATAVGFAAIEGDRESLERASAVVEGYAERECNISLVPDRTTTTDSTVPPQDTTGAPASTTSPEVAP